MIHAEFFLNLKLTGSIKLDDVPVTDLQSVGVLFIVYLTFHVGGLLRLIKHRAPSGAQIPNTHILQYAAHMLSTPAHSYRCFLLHQVHKSE